MARSLRLPDGEEWPTEDGWPYGDADPDADADEIDPADPEAAVDDDLVALHVSGSHLLDGLDSLQRQVVAARFGLDGRPARSMREIQAEVGLPREDLRRALSDGLAKVRAHLA